MPDDPYRPPAPADTAPAPRVDLRRAAIACAAWLVGSSTLTGATLGLQTGHALAWFGSEARIAPLVAVSALRSAGPNAAAVAAAIALVAATHRAPRPGARSVSPTWLGAAVPLGMPLAALVMTAAGAGVTAAIHRVDLTTSLRMMRGLVLPVDLAVGLAIAAADGLVVAALASPSARRLAASRWSLAKKLVAALAVSGLCAGLVAAVVVALVVRPEPPPNVPWP